MNFGPNVSFGFGSSGGGGGGGGFTSANNGLTSTGTTVQWGQTQSAVGDPGALLHTTEIPFAGFIMNFIDRGNLNKIGFNPTAPGITLNVTNWANTIPAFTLFDNLTSGAFSIQGSKSTTNYAKLNFFNGSTNQGNIFFVNSGNVQVTAGNHATPLTDQGQLLQVNGSLWTNGAVQFATYGSGTHTGTATFNLAVDASGNLIEVSAAGGLTAANDGLSATGSTAKLGQALGAGGNPAALTESREIPFAGFLLEYVDKASGSFIEFNPLFPRMRFQVQDFSAQTPLLDFHDIASNSNFRIGAETLGGRYFGFLNMQSLGTAMQMWFADGTAVQITDGSFKANTGDLFQVYGGGRFIDNSTSGNFLHFIPSNIQMDFQAADWSIASPSINMNDTVTGNSFQIFGEQDSGNNRGRIFFDGGSGNIGNILFTNAQQIQIFQGSSIPANTTDFLQVYGSIFGNSTLNLIDAGGGQISMNPALPIIELDGVDWSVQNTILSLFDNATNTGFGFVGSKNTLGGLKGSINFTNSGGNHTRLDFLDAMHVQLWVGSSQPADTGELFQVFGSGNFIDFTTGNILLSPAAVHATLISTLGWSDTQGRVEINDAITNDSMFVQGYNDGAGNNYGYIHYDSQAGGGISVAQFFTPAGHLQIIADNTPPTDNGALLQVANNISVGEVTNPGGGTMNDNFMAYTATGTTNTWTAPDVTNANGKFIFIKNQGSGNLTINSFAGASDFYTSSAVNVLTVSAGNAILLVGGNGKWNVE